MKGDDSLTVAVAEATVKILDVNDVPPTFNKRDYHVEIPENIPKGMPLPNLNMFVKDPDMVSILHCLFVKMLINFIFRATTLSSLYHSLTYLVPSLLNQPL